MRLSTTAGRPRWRRLVVAVPILALFSALSTGAQEDAERSELSALLSSEVDAGFATATEPRDFAFPQDHGPHPEFRNEWWYMTGNLEATDGRRFGFELTIFRFALTPEQAQSESAWRTNQVYIAHFAVTDADAQEFFVAERFSRGALGLAGAEADPFRVWIDDWELATVEKGGNAERWRLQANDEEFALQLELSATKAPVLNGIDGLSQKSAERGNASYYYSITRWQSEGLIRIGSDQYRVRGLSWLDREWSSSALAADQKGWDWFALQLDDGSELMFYNLRKTDGSQDAYSAGTWIAADGSAQHIGRDEISISETDNWQSPQGGLYPAGWEVRYAKKRLVLTVAPVMADQELFTTVRYWEGAVDIEGMQAGSSVRGHGYVELTGYANRTGN